MAWMLNSDRPLYLQLVEQIQRDIISGNYHVGDKLPSVRDLATEAAVNPNTMQKALATLETMGLVASNRTSGRFITEDAEMITRMKYDLAKMQFKEFVRNLKQLGFRSEEIRRFVDESFEEERNGDLENVINY